jgi:hypothetical protein
MTAMCKIAEIGGIKTGHSGKVSNMHYKYLDLPACTNRPTYIFFLNYIMANDADFLHFKLEKAIEHIEMIFYVNDYIRMGVLFTTFAFQIYMRHLPT